MNDLELNTATELYKRYICEQGRYPAVRIGCREKALTFANAYRSPSLLWDESVADKFDERMAKYGCNRSLLLIPVAHENILEYLVIVGVSAEGVKIQRIMVITPDGHVPFTFPEGLEFTAEEHEYTVLDGILPTDLLDEEHGNKGLSCPCAVYRPHDVDKNAWTTTIPVNGGLESVTVGVFPDEDLTRHEWFRDGLSGEVYRYATDEELINGTDERIWLCCEVLIRSDMRLGLFRDFTFEDIAAPCLPCSVAQAYEDELCPECLADTHKEVMNI